MDKILKKEVSNFFFERK